MTAGVFSAASTDRPSALPKMPVAIAPGEIELTRMPDSPSSIATHLVRWITAAFAAPQTIDPAEPVDRKPDQRFHLRFDRDVGLAKDAIGAEFLGKCLALRRTASGDDDF